MKAFLENVPSARIGASRGMYRNEETLEPVPYFQKLWYRKEHYDERMA